MHRTFNSTKITFLRLFRLNWTRQLILVLMTLITTSLFSSSTYYLCKCKMFPLFLLQWYSQTTSSENGGWRQGAWCVRHRRPFWDVAGVKTRAFDASLITSKRKILILYTKKALQKFCEKSHYRAIRFPRPIFYFLRFKEPKTRRELSKFEFDIYWMLFKHLIFKNRYIFFKIHISFLLDS